MITIKISSIFVDDQKNAEEFYTKTLGLTKKADVPVGEYRWITVGSSESEFALSLEPNAHPAAKQYQEAIFADGIPATMLFVDDIAAEYERLKGLGVEFKSEPQSADGAKLCIFNDTCGNWIMLYQE